MNIAEIFASVQGEGIYAGTPSVFVRIGTGRCHWCGGSKESWYPDMREAPFGAVLSAVRRHWLDHVVLTGPDPMAEDGIGRLTECLRGIDQFITIETGGRVFTEVTCDLMSIALDRPRGDLAVVRRLMAAYPYQLKITLSQPDEVEGANALLRDLRADRRRVVLLVEKGSAAKMRERANWVLDVCRTFGYRYSPHLQLDLPEKSKPRG